jgi:WD40 repeat protein
MQQTGSRKASRLLLSGVFVRRRTMHHKRGTHHLRANPLSPLLWIAACAVLGLALFVTVDSQMKAQTSTLYGLVTAPDGLTPVEGCSMELWPVGGSAPLAWDTTLIDGSFAFATAALPLGNYVLVANPPPQSGFGTSAPFDFALRSNVDDVDAGTLRLTYPQVEGIVVQPDGQRYPLGDVNLCSLDGTISLWGSANETKTFRFADLPPGQYEVQNVLPPDAPFWPMPSVAITITEQYVYDISQRQFITITLAYAQVEGVVVEPGGATWVAADSVNLQSLDGQVSEWSTTTADQPFRFGGLPDGAYTLQVFLPEDSPFLAPPPQPLTLDRDITHFVTVQLYYPQVEGIVVEPDGVTRAGGWDVNLRDLEGTVSLWDSGPVTKSFSFSGLAAGSYFVAARPLGLSSFWSSVWVPITVTEESRYQIRESQFLTLTLTYPQVEGFVTEPDGLTPFAAGDVNLRSADGTVSLWDSSTASKDFRFGHLAVGSYLIEARSAGASPFLASEAKLIAITEDSQYQITGTQFLSLPLTYPQVEGVVIEPDGVARLSSGDVNLKSADGLVSLWDSISAAEGFKFGGLDPGIYRLQVMLPAGSFFWAPEVPPIDIEAGSMYRPPEVMTITLQSPNVMGTVTYNGQPVAGASVGVYNFDGAISNWTTTGSDGRFAIGGLKADRYTLGIEAALAKSDVHWIGVAPPILFPLPDPEALVDLGPIELELWSPLLNTYLRHPR